MAEVLCHNRDIVLHGRTIVMGVLALFQVLPYYKHFKPKYNNGPLYIL